MVLVTIISERVGGWVGEESLTRETSRVVYVFYPRQKDFVVIRMIYGTMAI